MWEIRAGDSMVKSMYITGRGCDGALTEIKIQHYISSQKGKIIPPYNHRW